MPPAGADSAAGSPWRPLVFFNGKGGDLFVILLVNFLLSAITLGIYSFWGTVRRRAYLWRSTYILGEPLEYTGTGKELFISFLIVIPIFLIIGIITAIMVQFHAVVGLITTYLLFIFLWQYASYRALRYRLTRTRWRGIRGNLGGSPGKYAVKGTGYVLAMLFSAGLAAPWAISRMVNMQLNNVFFGNRPASFHGTGKELCRPYFMYYLCMVVIFGALGWFIYDAGVAATGVQGMRSYDPYNPYGMNAPAEIMLFLKIMVVYLGAIFAMVMLGSFWHAAFFRWIYRNMRFGTLHMRSILMGTKLLGVRLTNMLLVLFTFGIGFAWAYVRELGASLNSVQYAGDPDLSSLLQDTRTAPAHGEGLLEAMDVDIAF